MASSAHSGLPASVSLGKKYLPPSFAPSSYDIICGRGKDCYNHVGNCRFRVTIEMTIPKYLRADSKTEKTIIVMSIVDMVRSNCPNGGGFVRFDRNLKQWYEIGDEAAREKVGQSLRETMVQKDPEKRAKKRLQRAISKARKMAAKKKELPPPTPRSLDNASKDPLDSALALLDPLPIGHKKNIVPQKDEYDMEADLMAMLPSPAPLNSNIPSEQVQPADADAILDSIPLELSFEPRLWFSEHELGVMNGNMSKQREGKHDDYFMDDPLFHCEPFPDKSASPPKLQLPVAA